MIIKIDRHIRRPIQQINYKPESGAYCRLKLQFWKEVESTRLGAIVW